MARKKQINYFQSFCAMGQRAVNAAQLLHETMSSFELETFMDRIALMHKIENEADAFRHEVLEAVAREFITPIERQDIASIANMIDDVTDAVEDVLMHLYMFNIRELREETQDFTRIIQACSGEMIEIMTDFEDFRKSNDIRRHIIEINDLEEEADAVYVRSIRRLYEKGEDPVTLVTWTELFRHLEACCDAFESVSQTVEHVIMKNT